METQRTDKRGFTIVELLVVMAIIAILAAVAIPTLIRSGAFQSEYIEQSGRTLYNMLKAGEYYASTYNVETCVAYAAEEQIDNVTGQPAIVARSLGVFRLASDDEMARWDAIHGAYTGPGTPDGLHPEEMNQEVKVFVPVAEYELTELEPGACILGEWLGDVDPPLYSDFWADEPGYPAKGLVPVRIRSEEYNGVVVQPYLDFAPLGYTSIEYCWPAHIFKPAGYVDTNVSEERLIMNVGATLQSDPEDRFLDVNDTPVDPTVEFPGYAVDYYPLRPTRVQLSKSSARVKIIE